MKGVLPASPVVEAAAEVAGGHELSTVLIAIAAACGIWFCFILLVQTIGTTQLYVEWAS
jgi:hypothetical protein